jgi:Translation initiation factor IF-2, N-terminal region
MEHDYMGRGYLLPEGCKDLIDVLERKQERTHYLLPTLPTQFAQSSKGYGKLIKPRKHPAPLPPIKGEVFIPARTTVSQLASLLGQKPILIVADLMQMGVFASVWQLLGFETISIVARKYGFIARKTA